MRAKSVREWNEKHGQPPVLPKSSAPAAAGQEEGELFGALLLAQRLISDLCYGSLEMHEAQRIAQRIDEPIQKAIRQFQKKSAHNASLLEELFMDMLAAEVHRHGGIPHLGKEELAFREALAEFLDPKAERLAAGKEEQADLEEMIKRDPETARKFVKFLGLELKEASEPNTHVLQKERELLTRWMKRSAGYLLLHWFSVAAAINECMRDLEIVLSSHATESSSGSGLPKAKSSSPSSSQAQSES